MGMNDTQGSPEDSVPLILKLQEEYKTLSEHDRSACEINALESAVRIARLCGYHAEKGLFASRALQIHCPISPCHHRAWNTADSQISVELPNE